VELQALSDTKWIKRRIIQVTEGGPYKYELLLPDYLAKWDVYEYWEKERLLSMEKHMSPTDVIFDIGAEHGWLSAIIAKYFTEKIVLFEPTPEFWPNIKAVWEMNNLPIPLACFQGLVGGDNSGEYINYDAWPDVAQGDYLCPKNKYYYLHDSNDAIPRISIDNFCAMSHIKPKVLNIDVEGAELQVLNGALRTLLNDKPMIWVSIHPDLMQRDYKTDRPDILHDLLWRVGYEGKHLATDHEEHWFYKPMDVA
jgi:FkbM family methyltransferase